MGLNEGASTVEMNRGCDAPLRLPSAMRIILEKQPLHFSAALAARQAEKRTFTAHED